MTARELRSVALPAPQFDELTRIDPSARYVHEPASFVALGADVELRETTGGVWTGRSIRAHVLPGRRSMPRFWTYRTVVLTPLVSAEIFALVEPRVRAVNALARDLATCAQCHLWMTSVEPMILADVMRWAGVGTPYGDLVYDTLRARIESAVARMPGCGRDGTCPSPCRPIPRTHPLVSDTNPPRRFELVLHSPPRPRRRRRRSAE